VALAAGDSPVFTSQRVSCLVMIECRYRIPGCFIMATGTSFIKGRLMFVLVTIGASGKRNIFPFLLPVTFFAIHLPVCPFKWERGIIMIKRALDLFKSLIDWVAFFAADSQLALVNIFMAGDTVSICQQKGEEFFPWYHSGFVVAAATIGDGFVKPLKDMPGFRMIKVFCFQLNQLKFFSVVLWMAGNTISFFISMITFPCINSSG
jgi:hypothetical protein